MPSARTALAFSCLIAGVAMLAVGDALLKRFAAFAHEVPR